MIPANINERRFVLLCEGAFGVIESKVASAFIRYHEERCVAVVNSEHAGCMVSDVIGWGRNIPVVASVAEAIAFQPDTLIIGVSVQGKSLPESWRLALREAIQAKLDVLSGLNYYLTEDPEFVQLAKDNGTTLYDTKKVELDIPLSKARVLDLDTFVIQTVGSDCRVGKKTTALEITHEARNRGINANFGATGQTGIMISGSGVCVDSVQVDFLGGATEKVVLDASQGAEWTVVEGQGSITHPSFAGGTVGMLYGSMPQAMVFCHHHGRECYYGTDLKIPSFETLIDLHHTLTRINRPSKVVGVSLNTYPLDNAQAEREIKTLEDRLQLPVTDPVKFGVANLVDAIAEYQKTY